VRHQQEKSDFLVVLDMSNCNLGFAEHKDRGIRFNILHSDEFTGVSINIGKILLATRLVSRSYIPLSRLLESGTVSGAGSSTRDRMFSDSRISSPVDKMLAAANSSEVIGLAVLFVRATYLRILKI
jgi:hypothetical protein